MTLELPESKASLSTAAALGLILYPSYPHRILLQRAETRSRLLLGLGTGAGGLEKDGDVVGLTRSFVQRSAERTTADFGA
jgi:hypothetical protein